MAITYPYILLAYLLEVGVDFLDYEDKHGYRCHEHNICEHKFICLMVYTIGCCL